MHRRDAGIRKSSITGLRCYELVAPFVINAAMNGDVFGTCVRPAYTHAQKRRCRIWVNLNIHKNGAAHKAIKERDRYSPELTPIENAFSKLKT